MVAALAPGAVTRRARCLCALGHAQRIASRSDGVALSRRREPRRAELDDQHVPPFAVEAPVALVRAHVAPAARAHQGDARARSW